jgi:hypothetical protein
MHGSALVRISQGAGTMQLEAAVLLIIVFLGLAGGFYYIAHK